VVVYILSDRSGTRKEAIRPAERAKIDEFVSRMLRGQLNWNRQRSK
jgi:hypothetical protein